MEIPSDILKSLSLIKHNEIASVKRSLSELTENKEIPRRKLKKIHNTNYYILRASKTYRILLKRKNDQFEFIDLVHYDKLDRIIIKQIGMIE